MSRNHLTTAAAGDDSEDSTSAVEATAVRCFYTSCSRRTTREPDDDETKTRNECRLQSGARLSASTSSDDDDDDNDESDETNERTGAAARAGRAQSNALQLATGGGKKGDLGTSLRAQNKQTSENEMERTGCVDRLNRSEGSGERTTTTTMLRLATGDS